MIWGNSLSFPGLQCCKTGCLFCFCCCCAGPTHPSPNLCSSPCPVRKSVVHLSHKALHLYSAHSTCPRFLPRRLLLPCSMLWHRSHHPCWIPVVRWWSTTVHRPMTCRPQLVTESTWWQSSTTGRKDCSSFVSVRALRRAHLVLLSPVSWHHTKVPTDQMPVLCRRRHILPRQLLAWTVAMNQ